MITFIIAGLAGLWLWVVLNDDQGIASPLTRLCQRTEFTNKWMTCPWCSGAWFSGAASVIMYHPSIPLAIIMALASASVTGLLGSYIEGN